MNGFENLHQVAPDNPQLAREIFNPRNALGRKGGANLYRSTHKTAHEVGFSDTKHSRSLLKQELSPIVGDGRGRSGGGGRLMVDRFGDDLDPVVECHAQDQFWQLVVTIETAP